MAGNGLGRLKVVLLAVVGGFVATSAAFSSVAAADIEVVKEILLESGHFPTPHVLANTKDGGYVIAGHDTLVPWATRVDHEGRVQWRHTLLTEGAKPGSKGGYEGAATLSDDSTLLCGSRSVGRGVSVGILTHISKVGEIVSQRELYPQGDKELTLNYLGHCVSRGDGVLVLGRVSRWTRRDAEPRLENMSWLLAIDNRGNLEWEKVLPNISVSSSADIAVLPNLDFVVVAGAQVTQLDRRGNIKHQREIALAPGEQLALLRNINPDSPTSVLPAFNETTISLYTLNERLEPVNEVKGPGGQFVIEKAYRLNDDDLVLFGYESVGANPADSGEETAGILKLSRDLQERRSSLFKPLWVSSKVIDALPTSNPNEFVTLRDIHPLKRSPSEKRMGLVLAFVRIKCAWEHC